MSTADVRVIILHNTSYDAFSLLLLKMCNILDDDGGMWTLYICIFTSSSMFALNNSRMLQFAWNSRHVHKQHVKKKHKHRKHRVSLNSQPQSQPQRSTSESASTVNLSVIVVAVHFVDQGVVLEYVSMPLEGFHAPHPPRGMGWDGGMGWEDRVHRRCMCSTMHWLVDSNTRYRYIHFLLHRHLP